MSPMYIYIPGGSEASYVYIYIYIDHHYICIYIYTYVYVYVHVYCGVPWVPQAQPQAFLQSSLFLYFMRLRKPQDIALRVICFPSFALVLTAKSLSVLPLAPCSFLAGILCRRKAKKKRGVCVGQGSRSSGLRALSTNTSVTYIHIYIYICLGVCWQA